MHIFDTIETDVLVVGTGCAGFTAAVAAGRLGARVIAAERYGCPGGIMTVLGNSPIAMFHTGTRPIIRGIGWEFCERLRAEGHAKFPDFEKKLPHPLMAVDVNVPAAAEMIDRMFAESGVAALYNAPVVDVETDGRRVTAALLSTHRGILRVRAKQFVDASGDGDVAFWAGNDALPGDDVQPGTLRFYVEPRKYDGEKLAETEKLFNASFADGELRAEDVWSHGAYARLVTENGNNIGHAGMSAWDDPFASSEAEAEARRSVMRVGNVLERAGLPPLAAISPAIGPRETRRVRCDTVITGSDYASGHVFDDAVCYAYYPIDIHKHDTSGSDVLDCRQIDPDHPATVPYSALVAAKSDNVLVAGRCVSADREAQSGLRVKSPCMAMGQASGAAAALCAADGTELRALPIEKLRAALESGGAIVPR